MTRRRWPWLLLLIPLAAGLIRLRFDADVLNLLPGDLPSVVALRLHQQYFTNARELLVTVSGTNPAAVSLAARTLATRLAGETRLVRSARWQAPWLDDPSAVAENLAWMWLQQPPDEFARLSARLSATNLNGELVATRETLATSLDPFELARSSYDPLGFSRLPGASGPPAGFDTGTGIFANEVERVSPVSHLLWCDCAFCGFSPLFVIQRQDCQCAGCTGLGSLHACVTVVMGTLHIQTDASVLGNNAPLDACSHTQGARARHAGCSRGVQHPLPTTSVQGSCCEAVDAAHTPALSPGAAHYSYINCAVQCICSQELTKTSAADKEGNSKQNFAQGRRATAVNNQRKSHDIFTHIARPQATM